MMERRIFDWRFVLAFAVLMLAAVASWGFVQRQQQIDGLIVISQRTTAQVQVLNDQLDQLQADADAAEVAASAERDRLRQQNRVERAQFRTLLKYLREQGIDVPQSLVRREIGGGASPKGRGPRGPDPTPPRPPLLPVPLVSPGPTATPTPTSPSLTDQLCALLRLPSCPLP